MKIKKVVIEGLHNCKMKEYVFGNVTYLYGPNGSGKSTVLNAIQLALLGYIPGTAKQNQAIFRHATDKAMIVKLYLDDNGEEVTIKRTWVGAGSKIATEVRIEPDRFNIDSIVEDIELPIFNFSELTSMTANGLKDWFIKLLPNSSGNIDWRKELRVAASKVDDAIIDNVIEKISEYEETGIDLLQKLNEYFKSEQSVIRGRIQQLQNTINSLIYYDDAPNMSSDEIKARLSELMGMSQQISRYEIELDEYNRNSARLEAARNNCPAISLEHDEEYNKILAELQQEIIDYSKELALLQNRIADNKAKISSNVSVINSDGVCPFTLSKCQSIEEQISMLIHENAKLTEEVEADKKKFDELTQLKRGQDAKASADVQRKMTIVNNYNILASVIGSCKEYLPIRPYSATLAEIRQEVDSLQGDLAKIEGNKRYNELIDKITVDKFNAEIRLEAYKAWDKLTGANGLQTRIAEDEFNNLREKIANNVSLLTPKDNMDFCFNLSEKANSFSFGCKRDDKYIPFDLLSSGEKCIITIALMMTIIEISGSRLHVVMVDDLLDHLDDDNATMIFNSLSNIKDIQFILAGVKKCDCDARGTIVKEVGD